MKILMLMLWAGLLSWVGVDQFQRWQKSDTGTYTPIDSTQTVYKELVFVDYKDTDYGFSMVVPRNWDLLPSAELYEATPVSDLGYSVMFESPLQNESDIYADYIMVEVLPGIETGGFISGGEHRELITIDGQKAIKDQIILADFPIGGRSLDLSIRQAEIAQLGFTVGLYAIGTRDNAQMLDEAFRALLYSFELPKQPYLIAQSSAR